MSNFLEDIAYLQYENKLPERYDRKPACVCACCGEDMYLFDRGYRLNNKIYCDFCVDEITITEEEMQ